MQNPRTALRGRFRRGLLGGLAVIAAAVSAGCDSAVGIPGDGSEPATTTGATTTADTATTGANAPGDTPGNPVSEAGLAAWAADLRTGDLDSLEQKCWTMAPLNVRGMYAESAPILAALEQPGAHNGTTTVWKGPAVTVVAPDRALATDYACPYVFPAGTEVAYNDADARHTVRRYLSRLIGEPIDPADTEAAYPLVCAARAGSWDPEQTGSAGTPPLAADTDKLTGVTAFIDQSIQSEWPRGDYITVTVPVTNAAGVQQKRTFTLKSGDEGYCIGDVSP
ncbi:hypothetical protein [Nocardia sp. NPDC050406]|uniref:hypothetical protein n=1 Tax=Nocardia sp. NPDC050406 TaxID=3364318 RepID=UPI0037B210CD